MTVNYLVHAGVKLAFLEQDSTESSSLRNVVVGGYRKFIRGYWESMGEERDREIEGEREEKKRRREGGGEGQRATS